MSGGERTAAFCTLGCKLNQYETYDMEEQFRRRGYRILPFGEKASVYVINTCTVTAKSDYRCRQTIRKARRRNPDARVIAVGCYAQTQPGALAGMPEVDLVVGNGGKSDLFAHLTRLEGEGGRVDVSPLLPGGASSFGRIRAFGNHTRAFVKIQDGCDARCSYCIVPRARGPNRSRPSADVIRQVEGLAAEGYLEIVLTGVHLGTWGRDLAPADTLASLLGRIAGLSWPGRIRLSSIEPTEFTPELIDALTSARVCPHLHIPLQSGSAETLRAMNRPYGPEGYARLVERLVARLPDLGLGADIIAGFPGESDRHFEETYRLVESLPLYYLHVFPYSRRPGTAAADLPGQVAPEAREERAGALRRLGAGKSALFRTRRLGHTYEALVETMPDRDTGLSRALTGNYLKVLAPAAPEASNTLRRVRLDSLQGGTLYGEILT